MPSKENGQPAEKPDPAPAPVTPKKREAANYDIREIIDTTKKVHKEEYERAQKEEVEEEGPAKKMAMRTAERYSKLKKENEEGDHDTGEDLDEAKKLA